MNDVILTRKCLLIPLTGPTDETVEMETFMFLQLDRDIKSISYLWCRKTNVFALFPDFIYSNITLNDVIRVFVGWEKWRLLQPLQVLDSSYTDEFNR